MKNNFTQKTRDLFDLGGYALDWEDGHNDADCLHHILGRVSASPFNAAPLNNFRTHMPDGRHKEKLDAIHCHQCRKRLLIKTKLYLESIGYLPIKEDLSFLDQNKKYYD